MAYHEPVELIQPYTLFWRVFHNGQASAIKVDVDLRSPLLNGAQLEKMLKRWWGAVWAKLLPRTVQCLEFGAIPFFAAGPAFLFVTLDLAGSIIGVASSIDKALVVVLWGGSSRPDSQQRFYIPFIPTSFHNGEVMQDGAVQLVSTYMRAMALGCDGLRGGIGPVLAIPHPPVASSRFHVPRPATWEDVEQVIICTYLDKAPPL